MGRVRNGANMRLAPHGRTVVTTIPTGGVYLGIGNGMAD
jgi:hypothetical protein